MSGLLQFMQEPVLQQGVLSPKRWVFIGAASFLARFRALSTSGAILFMPTIRITFFGPNARAETLFALPSMFTSTPSSVIAFVLQRYTSAS